jgi:hypothetical protein
MRKRAREPFTEEQFVKFDRTWISEKTQLKTTYNDTNQTIQVRASTKLQREINVHNFKIENQFLIKFT